MDKRTFLAFLLIGLVFLLWSLFFTPEPQPQPPQQTSDTQQVADVADTGEPSGDQIPETDTTEPATDRLSTVDSTDPWYSAREGSSRFVTIETPLYTAVLNSRGALLYRFSLKEYDAWYGAPVQLIEDSTGYPGELGLTIAPGDPKQLNTRDLLYELPDKDAYLIEEGDSLVITARLLRPTANGSDTATEGGSSPYVEKRFTFHANTYNIDLDVSTAEPVSYSLGWQKGLMYQEHSSVDESSKAKAYVSVNDELETLDAELDEPGKTELIPGSINWVGSKTKYFAVALIPDRPLQTEATIAGSAVPADSNGLVETYSFDLDVPPAADARSFTLFVGPLEHDIANENDLTGMVDYGFMEFLIRPISEYVLLPIFRFIHGFIANWGLVIIVFSLLIRGALWPLSIPQIKSSEKMRLIQPIVTELREKFKDEPQKMQMETMKVYREYGVNPVGGCLPLLLQLPILYALWTTLANAIDLRQASFVLWINDLSVPDKIISLPFSLPLLGDSLSGLAIIMGATLFIQQKLMITDPKQKAIVYIMPVVLTIAFNYFPSGLNLYYLMYNLLSIGQHYYLRNVSKSSLTLEQLKSQAKGKKKGWLSRKMEEAQKVAEMQGRVPPGQKGKK